MKTIIKTTIIILSTFPISIGCVDEKSNVSKERMGHYSIDMLTDSIKPGEYLKAIASIDTPYFVNKNVKLIVYLDLGKEERLKKDLSNDRQVPSELFINLTEDIENQKWFKDIYDFDSSVVFGKVFSSFGEKSIRGYFLEYYGEYNPKKDTVYNGEMKKTFFEKKVYVRDSID